MCPSSCSLKECGECRCVAAGPTNGDGSVTYYDSDGGPLSTLRLTSIRDGIEDWHIFSKLGLGEHGGGADLISQVVRNGTEYDDGEEDMVRLESLRRQAARRAIQLLKSDDDSADGVPLPMYHAWPDQPESQDITGLVFVDGLWHLFMDCLPDPNPLFGGKDCVGHCTPLSWCHLSSPDLISWHQEPVAIRPDSPVDACCAETGGVTMTSNGTIFALYSTINASSWNISAGGAWDGNLALATATNTTLRTWAKHGAVADNVVAQFRSDPASPFPGINSASGFKDAAAPWLDFCSPTGEGEKCWFSLVSSGGDLSGKRVPKMTEACMKSGMQGPGQPTYGLRPTLRRFESKNARLGV